MDGPLRKSKLLNTSSCHIFGHFQNIEFFFHLKLFYSFSEMKHTQTTKYYKAKVYTAFSISNLIKTNNKKRINKQL